jgi:hypothetical protein
MHAAACGSCRSSGRPPRAQRSLEHAQTAVSHSYRKTSFVNRVLPMLPVNSVTYVPGRSRVTMV